MPTRVERLKKRGVKAAAKTVYKMKKAATSKNPAKRTTRLLKQGMKKQAKIVKKIVKTNARVTKRAVKKDARALNRRVKKATPSAAALAAYKAKKAAKMKKGRTISRGQGPSLQEKAAKRKM